MTDIRNYFKLTQDSLGQSIDVSRHVISQIELGKNRPTLDFIRQLAKKYSIKYEFFFEPEISIDKCVEKKYFLHNWALRRRLMHGKVMD